MEKIRWPYEWRKKEACQGIIPHFGGMQYRWDRLMENAFIHFCPLPESGINTKHRDEKVVVSLTSFPARIAQCYYSIKSLMLQDYKADKIILWLADSQFKDRCIPKPFEELVQAGLTIRYCDDLRSHKKYYYALQEQNSNELVITFDDDIIYESNAISKVVKTHEKFPECIVCNRGFEMMIVDRSFLPYSTWKLCSNVGVKTPAYNIMPSTGAGCLYPYGVMPKSTFDIEAIRKNAWNADDIWMRFNSLSNGIQVVKTREKIAALCNVYGSQKEALTNINNGKNENDMVIKRLEDVFPDVPLLLDP